MAFTEKDFGDTTDLVESVSSKVDEAIDAFLKIRGAEADMVNAMYRLHMDNDAYYKEIARRLSNIALATVEGANAQQLADIAVEPLQRISASLRWDTELHEEWIRNMSDYVSFGDLRTTEQDFKLLLNSK